MIVGDFNVDLSKPHSTSALDLLATFAGYGLHQVVQEPTRLTGYRHSLLDLVLCTNVSMICDLSINCPLGTSDHNSIAMCLTVDRPQVQRCRRRVWMYQKADFEAINVALEESLFPKDSISTWSVDWAWTTFESMFLSVIKHFIPCRTVPSRHTQPPWITKDVRRCLHQRNKAWRAAKASDITERWQVFRWLRNLVVSAVRSAKRMFFATLSDRVGSLKEFWRTYRCLTATAACLPATLSDGAKTASSAAEKATMLKKFFASCFGPPTLDSPSLSALATTTESRTLTVPITKQDNIRELSELKCTGMDVMQVISHFPARKATGPDGISTVMLKQCAGVISDHLAAIFNHSLSLGVVPAAWKISRVTPIPKSKDTSLVNNFKPISLLSLVGKIQERLVHEALLDHLLDGHFLSSKQFGFRPCSSTQEALLSLTRGWHEVLDNGGSVLCCIFRFGKGL